MKTKSSLVIATALTLLAGCATTPSFEKAVRAPATASSTPGRGPVCLPIQRGVNGAVADTRVAERWPDESYGTQSVAFAGSVGSAARYVLVDFDLGAIPEGAVITRATITLHASTNASAPSIVTAHRITTAWNEGTVTWSSFGGAFDPYVEAKLDRVEGDERVARFDVTRLVHAWRSGEQAQHGVLLKQDTSSIAFATSETAAAAQRPRLDVCFTVPGTRDAS